MSTCPGTGRYWNGTQCVCPTTHYYDGTNCQVWKVCPPILAVNGSCGAGNAIDNTKRWCIYAPTINVWCPDNSTPSNAWCTALNVKANVDSVCKPVPASSSLGAITNVDNIKISSFMPNIVETANVAPLSNVMYTQSNPIIVSDPTFPQNVIDELEGCTGTCKFVAADFNSSKATSYSSLPYVISTGSTSPENSAVFLSNTANTVTFTAPIGYVFSESGFEQTQSVSTFSSSSVAECAAQCDAYSGCTSFNYSGTTKMCQLFTGKPTLSNSTQFYGYKKQFFITSNTYINNQYPAYSNLNNQGESCAEMIKCNQDIQILLDDNVSGFSTNDISSCGYCPVRTYAADASGNTFVTNEIGTFRVTPTTVSNSLKYKDDNSNFSLELPDGVYTMQPWINPYFDAVECLVIGSQLLVNYNGKLYGAPKDKARVLGTASPYFPYDPDNTNVTNVQPVRYVDNGYVLRTGTGIITHGFMGDVKWGSQQSVASSSNPSMSYGNSGGSDRRLKTNIKRTGGYIGTLPEYTWDWNEKAHEIGWSHYPTRGVMAQEALEVYPDAVFMAPNGYYMVNYNLIQI